MATIKLSVKLSIGYASAIKQDVIEVEIPDDATEEETEKLKEEATHDWAWNYIDIGYEQEN